MCYFLGNRRRSLEIYDESNRWEIKAFWRWDMWIGETPGSCVKWVLPRLFEGLLSRWCTTTVEKRPRSVDFPLSSVKSVTFLLKTALGRLRWPQRLLFISFLSSDKDGNREGQMVAGIPAKEEDHRLQGQCFNQDHRSRLWPFCKWPWEAKRAHCSALKEPWWQVTDFSTGA